MPININNVQAMVTRMSHGYDVKIASLDKIKTMETLVIKSSTEVKEGGVEHVYKELVLTCENDNLLLLELTNIIRSNAREDTVGPYSNDMDCRILDQVEIKNVDAVYVDIRTRKITALNRLDYWFLRTSYTKLAEHDKTIPNILSFQA